MILFGKTSRVQQMERGRFQAQISGGWVGAKAQENTKPTRSVPEGFWFFKALQFCTRTPESLDFSPGSWDGIRRRLSQRGDVWLMFYSTLAMFIFGILQKEASQLSSEIYKDTTGDLLTWSYLLTTQLKHYTLIKCRGHIFQLVNGLEVYAYLTKISITVLL